VDTQQLMQQQLDQLRHQMQQEHKKHISDLEQRFEERLNQNNIAFNNSIATNLSNTLKNHLQQQQHVNHHSTPSPAPNLIDLDNPPISSSHTNIAPTPTMSSVLSPNNTDTPSDTNTTATLAKLIMASKEPKLYFQS
jgi:exonuclease VII large subunit